MQRFITSLVFVYAVEARRNRDIPDGFIEWLSWYNRSYTGAEYWDRAAQWEHTDQMIRRNNIKWQNRPDAYEPVFLAHNQFSDRYAEEIFTPSVFLKEDEIESTDRHLKD